MIVPVIILAAVLALLAVLLLLPVKAEAWYGEESAGLIIKIGPYKYHVLPRKPKTAEQKRKKKEKQKMSPDEKEEKPPDKEPGRSLIKPALRALGRLRRRLRIEFLRLRYTAAAGGDPYGAAMQYGYVQAITGSVLELLDKSFGIEEKDISIDLDFERDSPFIEFRLEASIIMWLLLAALIPYFIERRQIKHRLRRKERAAERKDKRG